LEKLKERDRFKGLGVNGRIKINLSFGQGDLVVEWICLWIWTTGESDVPM
jgi:hypothetical protein